MTEVLSHDQLYGKIFEELIPRTKKYLWIATADIKDLHVHKGKTMVPFLGEMAGLIKKGILVRLIHSKEPGKAFRTDFDRYPVLIQGLERMLCPRNHMKLIIVDGRWAFMGSPNLTGAGLGAKSPDRRNLETGILTDEKNLVGDFAEQFDRLWRGGHCKSCGRKAYCSEWKAFE